MRKLLHLTHTDIRSDSRILKEMLSAHDNGYSVSGAGVSSNIGTRSKNLAKLHIISLNLLSKKINYLPRHVRYFFVYLEMFFRLLYLSIKIRPDIIHCNDTTVLPMAICAKFFTRAKLVYDAHELESNRNGFSKSFGKLILILEKIFWRYIDGLIVVSPSIQRWYKDNLGEKPSAVILNSPVFKDFSFENGNYLRRKFDIPDESKIFIYIGILGYGRGIDIIVNAFKSNENSHVVFLGYGDYLSKLKDVEKSFPNIHIHDAVAHNKVVEIASSANVGLCLIQNVSLSDYYCLPNKLFEYSFSGLSVLASNFPDISNVVESYGIGLCVDLSEESIKEGIVQFEEGKVPYLADPQKLSELSWAAQEEKLIALYSKFN